MYPKYIKNQKGEITMEKEIIHFIYDLGILVMLHFTHIKVMRIEKLIKDKKQDN
jgi:hypothetical protein